MDFDKILDKILEDPDFLRGLSIEELSAYAEELEELAAGDYITQHALKILINALYGAQANKHFIMANPDLAAAITSSGRFFIQLMSIRIDERLAELANDPDLKSIVYNDTDAGYYTLATFVERKFGKDADPHDSEVIDWVDRFEKKVIQPCIQEAIDEYAEILNIYDPSKVKVEREIISDSAVFVAKKKYFARVQDAEGVRFSKDDPYIKVMGLEIAKSSTPQWVKKKLNESINVILDQTEAGLRKWRDEVRLEFVKQPIETICMVQGISNVSGDLNEKGLPQGTKSAIAHNNWVKQQGLEDEIELLTPGEKYKRCYLTQPNRFGVEVISFASSKIAKIIEEDGIYDFAKNFQLQFEQPLERMISGMNWNIEDKPVFGNLEDW